MTLPKPFFVFRAALFVFAVILLAGGPAAAADVCRLPAAKVFAAAPAASPYAFSSIRAGTGFAALTAAGTVSFTSAEYSIGEAGVTATILVQRTDDLSGPITVNFATSNGTAIAGQDYGHVSGTLFWADGDGDVKGFTIPISNDSLSEGNETVIITLSNPVGGAVIGSPGTAVLTIIDDEESIGISVNDVAQAEGNAPGFITFTVSLSAPATQTVTVTYSTQDGTAVSPADYTSVSGNVLVFNPGETSKPVSISTVGDLAVEPDETFTINLTDATNAFIQDASGTGTILNDDTGEPTPTPTPTITPTPTPGPSTIQFSSTGYSVNEGVGSAIVTVARTGSGTGAASVNYSTSNGSATAGQDYTAVSGTLTWAEGDTSAKTFNIPITDDLVIEGSETVNLILSSPSGATIGAPGTSVLTILDNDATPEISIADVSQLEGNSLNQMVFTVTLSNASGLPVTISYSTENGTATGGSDYVAIANTQLTFSPGETSKQIVTNILGDFIVEPDENFLLNITSATNGIIADSQAVGTLINDDAPGTIQFTAANYTFSEGAGFATITITRTGGLSQGVTVRFVTVDGTALAGEDYTSVRTTVNFAPGEASKTVNIPLIDDLIDEPTETINIALEAPTGGAILGSPINAIISITDNDAAPVLSVNNVTQNEGNTGTTVFTFTVTLAGQSSEEVTVGYSTANGTATAPSDYTAIPQGLLTFAPGETTKQVNVIVNGDFTIEANETFFVNLSSPLGATIGAAQGTGTINNDDVGGSFRFTSAEYLVGEGAGSILVTVQRTGGLAAGATVNYSTADGTATAGQDYTPVSGTLTFAGGQTTQSFIVPINNDGLNEVDESFLVILSNATGGGSTLGVPNTATIFISDSMPEPDGPATFDYDGDGRSDLSVRRPSNNIWYLLRETAGYTAQEFGVEGDRMAPADYDGDGKTDVAVFRPSRHSAGVRPATFRYRPTVTATARPTSFYSARRTTPGTRV